MRKLALTFSLLMTLVLPLQAIAGWSSCLFEEGADHKHHNHMMMGDHSCCPDNQGQQQGMDHHCHCHAMVHVALPSVALPEASLDHSVLYLAASAADWPSQTYQPEKPPQIA
jgi:uncharacterized protein involved in copper resistance